MDEDEDNEGAANINYDVEEDEECEEDEEDQDGRPDDPELLQADEEVTMPTNIVTNILLSCHLGPPHVGNIFPTELVLGLTLTV